MIFTWVATCTAKPLRTGFISVTKWRKVRIKCKGILVSAKMYVSYIMCYSFPSVFPMFEI